MASILSSGRGEVYIGFSIACEDNGISSTATIEDVITSIPLQRIIIVTPIEPVVTWTPVELIITVIAVELVVAFITNQGIGSTIPS